MKYILPIYEYVKNINNLTYVLDKFKKDISNLLINNEEFNIVDRTNLSRNINNYQFKLIYIKDSEIAAVEKLLENYINIFKKEELHFSYQKDFYNFKYNEKIFYYDCSIKSDMVFRTKPPKFIYHVTSDDNRDNIQKKGLIPSTGDWGAYYSYRPAIFATKDVNNLFGYNTNTEYRDIWQIDTTNLNNIWWVDLNINKLSGENHDNYIMTYEPIPPENLSLYKRTK